MPSTELVNIIMRSGKQLKLVFFWHHSYNFTVCSLQAPHYTTCIFMIKSHTRTAKSPSKKILKSHTKILLKSHVFVAPLATKTKHLISMPFVEPFYHLI